MTEPNRLGKRKRIQRLLALETRFSGPPRPPENLSPLKPPTNCAGTGTARAAFTRGRAEVGLGGRNLRFGVFYARVTQRIFGSEMGR